MRLLSRSPGVVTPTGGHIEFAGNRVSFRSPRDAQDLGIGTVHQDVGTIPLISVSRNFFLGKEPTKGWGPFMRIDQEKANRVALEALSAMAARKVGISHDPAGPLLEGR